MYYDVLCKARNPRTSVLLLSSTETWGLRILHCGRGGFCAVLAGSQRHPGLCLLIAAAPLLWQPKHISRCCQAFPWGTKPPLLESCSHRDTQKRCHLQYMPFWEPSQEDVSALTHQHFSAEPTVLKKLASGGLASRDLQQRPATSSRQRTKWRSVNPPKCLLLPSGLKFSGVSNFTLFLGSTRKTILAITDFLAFYLQSLTQWK